MFRQVTLDQVTENIGEPDTTLYIVAFVGVVALAFGMIGLFITMSRGGVLPAICTVIAVAGICLTLYGGISYQSASEEYTAEWRSELQEIVETEINGALTFQEGDDMPVRAGRSAPVTVTQDGDSRSCVISITEGDVVNLTCDESIQETLLD